VPSSYKKYTVEYFDSYDCLKLSKPFYLVLLFVLRGYIVWLMSVTNMRDKVGIIQWIYPDTANISHRLKLMVLFFSSIYLMMLYC
jgi:hypothetical protein